MQTSQVRSDSGSIERMPTSRSSIAKAAAAADKPEKAYEVRADKPVGLLLRVQPSGLRTYYVQIGRGKRVKVGPAGTYTLERAKRKAADIILDPEAYAKRTGTGATLGEYIADHYADHTLATTKTGADTLRRVKAVWKPLLNKRMTDIGEADIKRLRDKRKTAGTAARTVNRDTAALSGVFSHWVKNNKGATHPLANLAPLKVADDETIRYLLPDEAKRLRAALAARDANSAQSRASANEWRTDRGYELLPDVAGYCDHLTPMVLLSLNTGLRQGELFSLAWEAVDMRLKTITVLASHSKGNNTRTIPLNAEALAVLTCIRPDPATGLVFKSATGGRFNNVKKAWAGVTKAAKLPDLRWHDLRHDFASQLVMKGVPLFTVQKLLGHANSRMTQRYAKLAPGTLADAVDLLGSAV